MSTTSNRPLAVVTGASSGIGLEFARALAARGHDLVVVARRRERLEALAVELGAVEVHVVAADLATAEGVGALVRAVDGLGRPVDVLVNNAGFGSYGEFAKLELERELEMVDLNCRALVALTGHFLPRMAARGSGCIFQLASTASFQPLPYMATYAASKAFVLWFSEAVAREAEAAGVRVVAVCPGHTPTEFHAVSGADKRGVHTPGQSAAEVVREALGAWEDGAHTVVTGTPNKLTTQVARLMPRRVFAALLGRAFKPRT
jgi:hypothetical protein